LSNDIEVSWLINHFSVYRASNYLVWPNGKTRLYQPVKLTTAFDLLARMYNHYDELDREKQKVKK